MMKKLAALALCLALALFAVSALAMDAAFPGDLPERGISLPMTQEDLLMGLSLSYSMGDGPDGIKLPQFDIAYADILRGCEALLDFLENEKSGQPDMTVRKSVVVD